MVVFLSKSSPRETSTFFPFPINLLRFLTLFISHNIVLRTQYETKRWRSSKVRMLKDSVIHVNLIVTQTLVSSIFNLNTDKYKPVQEILEVKRQSNH